MYTYTYELTPSKTHSTINYCEKEVRATLLSAPENINDGYAFRRSGKVLRIDSDVMEPQRIVVTLSSPETITHASRSLSALTRYLTTSHANIWVSEIYHKTLFRMRLLSTHSDDTPEDLSDLDLMRGLMGLLFGDCTPDPALKGTITEVKRLILPFLKEPVNKGDNNHE